MLIICCLGFCIFVLAFRSLVINFHSCTLHRKRNQGKISIWFIRRCGQVFIFKIPSQLVQTNTKIPPELSHNNTKQRRWSMYTKESVCSKSIVTNVQTNKIPMQMGRARTKNVSFATFPFKLRLFFFQHEFVSYRFGSVCLLFAQFLTRSSIARKYWLHVSDLVLFVDCFITNQPFDIALYLCILKRRILRKKVTTACSRTRFCLCVFSILFVLGRCYRAL